jgi:DNA-binding protein Fis
MITLLITENEEKIRELLTQILGKDALEVVSGPNGTLKLQKKDTLSSIEESVSGLDNSLMTEKKGVLYKSIVEAIEKKLIEHVLERTEGNQFKAARILGINRNTIRSKLRKLGIDAKKWKIQ